MANLAIAGGKRVLPENSVPKTIPWPPRDEAAAERLKEVFLSGAWSFNSPEEQKFEEEFARYHGAKYGVFMANGTTTLEAILAAIGAKAGDEVIVPALTWMATALAGAYTGIIPVFVDIEPDTLCMDPEEVEKAITPKTKAIMPVHVYGSTADMERLLEIGSRHGIPVIEDAAHCHGGFWNGRGVGSWGIAGSFSFQQSKTMTSGEGGICITNDAQIADKLYLFKHIGYARNVKQGEARCAPQGMLCHNYRGTAFQACILSSQLADLKERMARYNRSAALIREALKDVPGVRIQAPGRLSDPQGYYSFHFIFDGPGFEDIPKSLLSDACEAEGYRIPNRAHGAVYQHALFNLDASKGEYRISGGRCKVCEELFPRMIGLDHTELYYEENAAMIAEVVRKVAMNPGELKKLI